MPYASSARALDVAALGRGEPLILDHLLGSPTAASIRRAVLQIEERGQLRPAGVGRGRDLHHDLRSDLDAWIDPSSADPRFEPLLTTFERLRARLCREAYLGLRRFEVQAAVYRPGTGYVRHRDTFHGGPSRRVTAIYYANPRWEPEHGGHLQCWSGSGVQLVEPVADRLVVFLSERLEHEVHRVRQGRRVAVTAWYWGP